MNPEAFYRQVIESAEQPPAERHAQLSALYTQVIDKSLAAVKHTNAERAQQQVPVEGDPRTFAQLIGHIAEWDRFAVLSAGDMLAGIQHPRMISDLSGYLEPDGSQPISPVSTSLTLIRRKNTRSGSG